MSSDPRFPLPPFPADGPGGPGPVTAQPVYNAAPIHNFRRDLFTATPRVFVTQTLVVINLAIFALMALTSGGFFSPTVQTMVHWGRASAPSPPTANPGGSLAKCSSISASFTSA